MVAALTDACGRYEADSELASAAAARAEEREQTVRAQRRRVRHRRVFGKFLDLLGLLGLHGVRRDVYNQRKLGKPYFMCFLAFLYAEFRSIP